MSKYVFDTSALMTYIENEAGADIVDELLVLAIDNYEAITIIKQKKLPYKK